MKDVRFRVATTLIASGLAALAASETYTAQIYSTPAGFNKMAVFGAGDNGMMSGYVQNGFGEERAAYRTATGAKIMHPGGWFTSRITDSWGSTYHCGYGRVSTGSALHALFWVGGGAATDLHPAGVEYGASQAFGGFGQYQVGGVVGPFECAGCGFTVGGHAGIWNRTAASFQRLHSSTHNNTTALATDGVRHVGYGTHRTDNSLNALLWNSTGSVAVNIRPSMSTSSQALSVWGNQQGGAYTSPATLNKSHAVIWAGTAASAVDLNPNTVFESSIVRAVRNGLQVGSAKPLTTPTRNQAIAWHGTANSWINLHAKLPYPFNLWHSFAEGIDNNGNVTGYITSQDNNDWRPVIWIRSN